MVRSLWSGVRGAFCCSRAVIVVCAMLGTAAGVLLWRFMQPPSMAACEQRVRDGDYQGGVEVCLTRYARTGHERALSWAAQAHMYLGELDEAAALAGHLLAGRLYGEGHRILSFVWLRRRLPEDARRHASLALAAHVLAGDERGATSDSLLLAQAAWKLGDFTASLEAADEALRLARRWNDPRNEVVAHLARADALRRMGDMRGAEDALMLASERATTPCDQAWVHLKIGMLQMEIGPEGQAEAALSKAAEANRRCGMATISSSVLHNQAWLLRWKDPERALEILDEIERSWGVRVEILVLRGYLAADRGDFAEANRHLTTAAGLPPPDADWPWEIARARAELAELRGGRFGDLLAELHYRQATAMIASLRGSARSRSAFLVASHRGAYDGLIALLARTGRWRDVLAVVLELDASDMLRATAAAAGLPNRMPLGPDAPATSPVAMPSPAVEAVLSAWRSRDLVIAIAPSRRQIGPGRERAYRMRIADGEVTGEDVGDASEARAWAGALFSDPGDRQAARALGRVIVPPGRSGETLHVLAIGPLGKVPLAALRDPDGSPSIARRPLVRVLALEASGPAARGASPPVVLADPQGNLAGAAQEGAVVAAALGPRALVSGSGTPFRATRARLWAARDAELLHVAAHVKGMGGRRALLLADGSVDPTEMIRQRLAPRLAVLASCGSAAAHDEEGWGSIAAALLESGTDTVIATDRSVGDAASLTVMRDFYAQPDWRADPARALARVQRALDARAATSSDPATKPQAWAAFSVLRRSPP